jgi:hypothetical protein
MDLKLLFWGKVFWKKFAFIGKKISFTSTETNFSADIMLTNFLQKFDQLHINTGDAVAHMVEALRYKLAGHRFNSRRCQWEFFIDLILPAALWCSGQPSF